MQKADGTAKHDWTSELGSKLGRVLVMRKSRAIFETDASRRRKTAWRYSESDAAVSSTPRTARLLLPLEILDERTQAAPGDHVALEEREERPVF